MVTAILVGYMVLMLGIGWWCSRTRIAGMTDFLLAGRRLGLVLCAAAMAATHFGGGALLGGAEYGYRFGLAGAWYGVSTGIGLCALALLTARSFRELALYTVPDYLERRYGGRSLRVLGALLSLVALVGILGAQVNAARGAFAIVGMEGPLAAVLATVVFVAYAALGGLWAATISDVVQITIAAVGVCLAAAAVMADVMARGGLEVVLAPKVAAESYLSLGGQGYGFIAWILLPTVMYTLIGQDFYQRLFAARSAAVARNAALLGGVFLIAVSFMPVLVGVGARALASQPMEGKQALAFVLGSQMHPALAGVVMAAVLAAIMSTADSLLTAATAHVVRDLWTETLDRGGTHDERQLLRVSRVVTVLVGFAALGIGVLLPTIVDLLIYSYTMYTAGVLVPVLGGVLWRGATRTGALSALAVGSLVALAGIVGDLDVGGVPTEVYAAVVSALVFVSVSLVTRRTTP